MLLAAYFLPLFFLVIDYLTSNYTNHKFDVILDLIVFLFITDYALLQISIFSRVFQKCIRNSYILFSLAVECELFLLVFMHFGVGISDIFFQKSAICFCIITFLIFVFSLFFPKIKNLVKR